MKDFDTFIRVRKHGAKRSEIIAEDLTGTATVELFRKDFTAVAHPEYEMAQLWIAGRPPKTRVFSNSKPSKK